MAYVAQFRRDAGLECCSGDTLDVRAHSGLMLRLVEPARGFNNHHYALAPQYSDWHADTWWREGRFALHTKHTDQYAAQSTCSV